MAGLPVWITGHSLGGAYAVATALLDIAQYKSGGSSLFAAGNAENSCCTPAHSNCLHHLAGVQAEV